MSLDAFGADLSFMCVVESNGALAPHDVLRMCGGDFARDTIFIQEVGLGEHVAAFNILQIQTPHQNCLSCRHFDSCGGGYLPHRFDGESFDQPSWYCDVLFGFFDHVEVKLREFIPDELWRVTEVPSDYKSNTGQ